VTPDDEHDLSWQADGACLGTDPDLFFAEAGFDAGPTTQAARATCQGCPARIDCLEYALAANEKWGVWGGFDPGQRRRLAGGRRDKESPVVAPRPRHLTLVQGGGT
jgi:WhiB family redox-sensing transcriptional regulator